jgi:hypothetical protein
MHMKKKWMACVLAGCMLMAMVSGCGLSGPDVGAEETEMAEPEPETAATQVTGETEEPADGAGTGTSIQAAEQWRVSGYFITDSFYTITFANDAEEALWLSVEPEDGEVMRAISDCIYPLYLVDMSYETDVPEDLTTLSDLEKAETRASFIVMYVEYISDSIDEETAQSIVQAALDSAGVSDITINSLADLEDEDFDSLDDATATALYQAVIDGFYAVLSSDDIDYIEGLMEDYEEEIKENETDGYLTDYQVVSADGTSLGKPSVEDIEAYKTQKDGELLKSAAAAEAYDAEVSLSKLSKGESYLLRAANDGTATSKITVINDTGEHVRLSMYFIQDGAVTDHTESDILSGEWGSDEPLTYTDSFLTGNASVYFSFDNPGTEDMVNKLHTGWIIYGSDLLEYSADDPKDAFTYNYIYNDTDKAITVYEARDAADPLTLEAGECYGVDGFYVRYLYAK